jgi:hypothetical protein
MGLTARAHQPELMQPLTDQVEQHDRAVLDQGLGD